MQSQLKNSNQRGYSLIELSITLAIIGVIIAGSIVGVQSILRTNNVNKVIEQTNTATNRIVAKLARDPDYSNATMQNLTDIGQSIWDPSQITGAGTATATVLHAFGSNVWVQPLSAATYGVLAKQGYVYSITGVPVAACSDLAVGLESLALGMSIVNEAPVALATGAASVPNSTAGNIIKQPGTPYNSQTAAAACNGPTGSAIQTSTIQILVPRS